MNPEEVLEDTFKMLHQAKKCIRKLNIFFSGGIYIYREKKSWFSYLISTIVSVACVPKMVDIGGEVLSSFDAHG